MKADLVFLNGTILTLDERWPKAEALAVVWDRIACVGDVSDVRSLAGPGTVTIDLAGRTLLPGFNEAHCHAFIYGQSKVLWRNLRPGAVNQLDDVLRIVAEEAARLEPGHWIRGRGFDPAALPPNYAITRVDLDKVSGRHPVCLTRWGGHVIVGNSLALELAGISRETPDPVGGKIDRDASGEPTGVLREAAQALLYDVIPPPSPEEVRACLLRAIQDYLAAGITSFQNAGTVDLDLKGFQQLSCDDALPIRVYLMVKIELLDPLLAAGIHTGLGDDRLRIGPLKIFLDGGIGAGTAAMDEPYEGDQENQGILWLEQDALDQLVERAHRAGFQIATHAIGDRAIRSVLDAYERALRLYPRPNHRHRIEHCELCTGTLLGRIVRAGVIPVPQPIFLAEMGHTYVQKLGTERAHQLFPLRSFAKAGLPFPGSSDSPVSSHRPLEGIQAAVTRLSRDGQVIGPGQEISAMQGLRMYTLDGAYASFEERNKGSLAEGKLADMVILDRDPLETPPDELGSIQVDATIVGGQIVYERANAAC